ncbi:MAG: DUF4097 domain-containing protein [Treponema sp.]|nr:DUF4097 domain-containing protein [Treponema sp.]
MNKSPFILGIIWVIIALAGTIFLVKGIGKSDLKIGEIITMKEISDNEEKSAEHVFDFQKLNTVKLESYAASINVKASADNKIHVNALGEWKERELPIVECFDGRLNVKTPKRSIHIFGIKLGKKEIEILLPKESLSSESKIDAECASGSLNFSDLYSGKLDLEAASGSIKMENCSAEKVSIEAASGSIKTEDCVFGFMDVEAASGSIKLSGKFDGMNLSGASGSILVENDIPFTKDSSIEAISGSVTLRIPEESEYRIIYESLSGSFKDEVSGTSGGRKGSSQKGNADCQLKVSSISGSIRILKK